MYETGVLVAFLLWSYGTIMIIVTANSLAARNLAKVGYRFSYMTSDIKPMSGYFGTSTSGKVVKFLLIAFIGLVSTLLSWLSVAYTVGTFVYQKSKQSGVPQNIKEFRWKLRNVDMPRDTIIREMMKLAELPEEQFEPYRDEMIDAAALNGVRI